MIKRSLAILPSVVLLLTACAPDASEPTGVVIVNARVVDGSGGPSRDVNVRVVGDRIANVGPQSPRGWIARGAGGVGGGESGNHHRYRVHHGLATYRHRQ